MPVREIHPHTDHENHRKILLVMIRKNVMTSKFRYTIWSPDGAGGIFLMSGVDGEDQIEDVLFRFERKYNWSFVFHRDTGDLDYYLRN